MVLVAIPFGLWLLIALTVLVAGGCVGAFAGAMLSVCGRLVASRRPR